MDSTFDEAMMHYKHVVFPMLVTAVVGFLAPSPARADNPGFSGEACTVAALAGACCSRYSGTSTAHLTCERGGGASGHRSFNCTPANRSRFCNSDGTPNLDKLPKEPGSPSTPVVTPAPPQDDGDNDPRIRCVCFNDDGFITRIDIRNQSQCVSRENLTCEILPQDFPIDRRLLPIAEY